MAGAFRSKIDGMTRRKPLWSCTHCLKRYQTKVASCSWCGSNAIQYFASTSEANRYAELKLLERNGVILGLKVQPAYPITINGRKICTYRGDFLYRRANGVDVLEDVKGAETDVFKLKKKLVEAIYGIAIAVVKA